ncbi:MAG: hypothetical protein DHS20C18_47800 [Saprospiraceae bacterium]|nr:MAG: hypothetical protein DHS20C18_47800 [Saprospiraceae bacterium]
MGLFDRIFGGKEAEIPQPDIRFGRYSDSYKEDANYDSWDLALEKFERDEYLDSYREFFRYLRDEDEDNVKWWEENGSIHFEIYQGSKKITGFANAKKLKAEAKVAKSQTLNVGFMRRLIEQNFSLKFSRFAIDEADNITVVFDSYTLDGSPYKLYYALKEVATQADKQDDLLVDEFKMLESLDTSHLTDLPELEKEVKYNFIQGEVETVLNEIESRKLNPDQYPGGISYLLLNLVYKLDYLIKPEGYMMETLERVHRLYFSKEEKTLIEKNMILGKELQKLLDRPKDLFFKEMYRVKTTFGITTPVNHDRVVGFIDGELNNMDWYFENQHTRVALAIPGYIVGYCMFNYAIPKPDRDFFHLYFQIVETEYFLKLGFHLDFYDPETQKLNKRTIRKAIDKIVDANRNRFTRLTPTVSTLNFDSLVEFTKSYLLMIRNLDLTKMD